MVLLLALACGYSSDDYWHDAFPIACERARECGGEHFGEFDGADLDAITTAMTDARASTPPSADCSYWDADHVDARFDGDLPTCDHFHGGSAKRCLEDLAEAPCEQFASEPGLVSEACGRVCR